MIIYYTLSGHVSFLSYINLIMFIILVIFSQIQIWTVALGLVVKRLRFHTNSYSFHSIHILNF